MNELPFGADPHGEEPPDLFKESRAPFMEHLAELRKRLVISAIAVAIGIGLTWTWAEDIFLFLLEPLKSAAENPQLAEMHHRSLTEHFFVLLKTSAFAGVLLAIPVILLQIWKFIAPGLYPEEKKMALPMVLMGTFCFLAGNAFCFKIVLPYGYAFLLSFGSEVSTPDLFMEEYLALTTRMMLAFGAVFEMPVVTSMLARIGLVNHKMMLGFWRYAFVICFVVGAMLTPPDIVSQALLAAPMMVIYFISVGCAWIFYPRNQEAAEEGS